MHRRIGLPRRQGSSTLYSSTLCLSLHGFHPFPLGHCLPQQLPRRQPWLLGVGSQACLCPRQANEGMSIFKSISRLGWSFLPIF